MGSMGEFLLAIFWMAFGATFYTYLVGYISQIVLKSDEKEAQLQKRISTLERLAERIHLPTELSIRI